jgi:hypothetical protein
MHAVEVTSIQEGAKLECMKDKITELYPKELKQARNEAGDANDSVMHAGTSRSHSDRHFNC